MPQENIDIPSVFEFGQGVDFSKTATDYSKFRAGFPESFFDALLERQWIAPGLTALDLGTGTGTIARGLARHGLQVTAIDPATALLEEAATLDKEAGVNVSYREGWAESLNEASGSVDVVSAGQCWHWFDRPKAAAEVYRALCTGGRVIIAHFDWIPLPGNVTAETESLIQAFNPAWNLGGGNGMYPEWLGDLATAGFEALETFSFDMYQPYTHAQWRGRVRASAGISATLDSESIARFDAALGAMLLSRFPEDPLAILHRVWAVSGVRRP
jgi:SAM-dependent methyltransferase